MNSRYIVPVGVSRTFVFVAPLGVEYVVFLLYKIFSSASVYMAICVSAAVIFMSSWLPGQTIVIGRPPRRRVVLPLVPTLSVRSR